MPKISQLGAASIAALKSILGLGSAAYTASTAYDAVGAAAGKADKVATSPAPTGLVATFNSAGNLATSVVEVEDLVSSEDITTIVQLTQAEYDALSPADSATLYIITD